VETALAEIAIWFWGFKLAVSNATAGRSALGGRRTRL
jgi:hypothetical protein